MSNKPHVHAELIKAWADGAKIEVYNYKDRCWEDIDDPMWSYNYNYRIKPQPKPDIQKECFVSVSGVVWNSYNPLPNLRLTFDGETYNLKSTEVIK